MEKEKPSAVHSKAGVRSASPRSGIGGGKRIEVAGERKKEQPVQRVSVRDVTSPKTPKAPVGTSENPRVGQPGKDKPKPTVRRRTTSTKGFGSFKPSQSGEEAYQKEKEKQETAKRTRTKSSGRRKAKEPNPKKPGKPSLDDFLKSEGFQIDEKTLTTAENRKKEEVFKSVTLDKLKKQYPEKSSKELEALRYAISTSMAKKIAEQALELQPKTQKPEQQDKDQKKISQQQDRMRQQEVQILQRKLQALRSAPKGTDPSITA